MMALRPEAGSWQKTTCSWPVLALKTPTVWLLVFGLAGGEAWRIAGRPWWGAANAFQGRGSGRASVHVVPAGVRAARRVPAARAQALGALPRGRRRARPGTRHHRRAPGRDRRRDRRPAEDRGGPRVRAPRGRRDVRLPVANAAAYVGRDDGVPAQHAGRDRRRVLPEAGGRDRRARAGPRPQRGPRREAAHPVRDVAGAA